MNPASSFGVAVPKMSVHPIGSLGADLSDLLGSHKPLIRSHGAFLLTVKHVIRRHMNYWNYDSEMGFDFSPT